MGLQARNAPLTLFLLLCVTLIGLSVVAAGCGGSSPGDSDNNGDGDGDGGTNGGNGDDDGDHFPGTASDTAVVLPTDGTVTSELAEDGTIALSGDVPAIAVGDVLVGSEGDGYLRRVTAISTDAEGNTVVETEPGSLEDIIENGSFQGVVEPSDDDVIIPGEGVTLGGGDAEASSRGSLSGSWSVGGGTVRIGGTMNFEPGVDIGADFEWFQIQEFHTILEGTLAANFNVGYDWSVGTSIGREWNLYEHSFSRKAFWIGPVPVWVKPVFAVNFGFSANGQVEGELSTAFNAQSQVRLGAEWTRDAGWSSVDERDFTWGRTIDFKLDANGNARAYLEIKFTLMIYDLIGPGVSGTLYGEAGFTASLLDATWQASLYAGVMFEVEITTAQIQVFGRSIGMEWSATLFDLSVELGTEEGDLVGDVPVQVSCIRGSPPTGGPPGKARRSHALGGVV